MREVDTFARRFQGVRTLVVGDAMLDRYIRGSTSRVAQEAPVPVVDVATTEDCAGGAANVAANAAALGAHTTLIAPIGDDAHGSVLGAVLDRHGVELSQGCIVPRRHTLVKTRVMAQGHMAVRYDEGSTEPADGWDATAMEALTQAWEQAELVIVSDYGYGAITPAVIEHLAALQAASPRTLAVDSKRLEAFRTVGPTIVKPNYAQVVALLGLEANGARRSDRAERIHEAADTILARTRADIAAITLDTDGAIIIERGREPFRTFVRGADQVRTVGAGDTYLSGFAMAIASRATAREAAELAAEAARQVVGQDGTAVCHGFARDGRRNGASPSADTEIEMTRWLETARRDGKRIVFTNGVFDILHSGHVQYLRKASQLGDVLVVGVNSDASVQRIKGPGRPVNTLADRIAVLEALDFVDYVVPFEETTPERLIRAVRPDVFVKGGDYTRETLLEAGLVEELGGAVVILGFEAAYSTTGLIERIQGRTEAEPEATSVRNIPDPAPAGRRQ